MARRENARDDEALETWPVLPSPALQQTCATIQMWTQIAGKIRLAKTPWLNHSWQVTLYLTARGLTTSPIPDGPRCFQIDFDFIDHALLLETSSGSRVQLPLVAEPVADFHARVMAALADLGIEAHIHGRPNELADAVPFDEDRAPRSYDPAIAHRYFRALVQVDRVFKMFRTGFLGKNSPVHFFWGAADLAVTRFSGRRAPPHPGGVPHLPDAVTREAYSHEVSSAGFWPGGMGVDQAAFYSYAYPEPAGFRQAPVRPEAAVYNQQLGEFILPYDAVRRANDPDATLLAFLQSTYDAAANAGGWDRANLECARGTPGVPRPVEAPRGRP
jgi:hypothetical protein